MKYVGAKKILKKLADKKKHDAVMGSWGKPAFGNEHLSIDANYVYNGPWTNCYE